MAKKTALIVGATGIIGRALLEHISGLNDWDAIGIARNIPDNQSQYRYVSVDLERPDDVQSVLANVGSDVTHIFYAAYRDFDFYDPRWIDVNLRMLKNVTESVETVAPNLERILLMQGLKVYGAHLGAFKTPAKETDLRYAPPNFYYALEDYLKEHQSGKSWAWTLLLPDLVAGVSIGMPMNIVTAIAIYATIFKTQNMPLRFPGKIGTYHAYAQITDANLIAHASVFLANEKRAAFENYNVTNGDIFKWENVWARIAEFFEMPIGYPQKIPLQSVMPLQKPIWEKIAAQHDLRPIPYEQLAGWKFADFIFDSDWDIISSTTKIRQLGFNEAIDSEEQFLELFKTFKDLRLIP